LEESDDYYRASGIKFCPPDKTPSYIDYEPMAIHRDAVSVVIKLLKGGKKNGKRT
jgi:hypothetical protein